VDDDVRGGLERIVDGGRGQDALSSGESGLTSMVNARGIPESLGITESVGDGISILGGTSRSNARRPAGVLGGVYSSGLDFRTSLRFGGERWDWRCSLASEASSQKEGRW